MIFLPAGPMLRGNYAGQALGSGSDAWKYWDERRAGNITDEEWLGIEGGIARSVRHLHDHGHRLDDDGDRRRDGADACPAPRRSRRRTPTTAHVGRTAAGASSRWSGRT